MKIIPFIFLLFVSQSPSLKVGKYQAAKPFKYPYDEEQSLTINPDGSFVRTTYEQMHSMKVRVDITGIWQQNADTLIMTDTMHFPTVTKATIKKIFGTDDTAVIRTSKYIIQKESRLHFISSRAGTIKPQMYPLPDFAPSTP